MRAKRKRSARLQPERADRKLFDEGIGKLLRSFNVMDDPRVGFRHRQDIRSQALRLAESLLELHLRAEPVTNTQVRDAQQDTGLQQLLDRVRLV